MFFYSVRMEVINCYWKDIYVVYWQYKSIYVVHRQCRSIYVAYRQYERLILIKKSKKYCHISEIWFCLLSEVNFFDCNLLCINQSSDIHRATNGRSNTPVKDPHSNKLHSWKSFCPAHTCTYSPVYVPVQKRTASMESFLLRIFSAMQPSFQRTATYCASFNHLIGSQSIKGRS